MEIQICQTCGVILKGKSKNCSFCGVIISKFSPTTLPLVSRSSAPLEVEVGADPLVLERVVTHRQYSALYGVGFTGTNGGNGHDGNGHEDGNGNGSNGSNGTHGSNGGNGQQTDSNSPEYGYGHPTLFGGASSMIGGFAGPSFGLNENYGGSSTFNDPVAPEDPPPSPMEPVVPTLPKLFDPAFNVQDEVNNFMSSAADEAPIVTANVPPDFTNADFLGNAPTGIVTASGMDATSFPGATDNYASAPNSMVPGASSASFPGMAEPTPAASSAPEPQTIESGSVSNQAVPSSNLAAALGAAGAMGGLAALGSMGNPSQLGSFGYMQNLNQGPQEQAKPDSFFGDEPNSEAAPSAIPQEARTAPPESMVTSGQFSTAVMPPATGQSGDDFFGSGAPSKPPEIAQSEPSQAPGKPEFVPGDAPSTQDDPARAPASQQGGDFDFFGGGAPPAKAKEEEPPSNPPAAQPPEEPKPAARHEEEPKQKGSDSAPPTSNPLTDFFGVSGSAPPPIGGGGEPVKTSQPPSSAKGGDDFFSNSTSSKQKAIDTDFDPPTTKSKGGDDFFPDESRSRRGTEDEERPKVAMSIKDATKGKSSSSASRMRSMQAEDLDDDEDEDEDRPRSRAKKKSSDAPPRRSFSGGSKAKKSGRNRDDDEDEDDESNDVASRDDDDDEKQGFLAALDGEVNLLGMTLNKKAALTLCAFALIVLVQLPGWIGGLTSLAGGGNTSTANSGGGGGFNPLAFLSNPATPTDFPPVSGDWQVIGRATVEGKAFNFAGAMRMSQNETGEIGGQGSDQGGTFLFKGNMRENNKVTFVKQYLQNGQLTGKPITYDGVFDTRKKPMEAGGIFQTQVATGHFIHRKVMTVTGQWKARMTQQLASNNPDMPQIGTQGSQQISGSSVDSVKGPQKFFMWIAGGMLAVGLFIFLFFLYLFGPAGKMNYWEKQKYIPSQFKGQHNKMLAEMAKPIKPGGLPLGKRCEWNPVMFWTPKDLAIPADMRKNNPHILVIGAGDKGKTRLVASMVCHDIEAGDRAVIVIDSDGSLSDLTTRWMSAHPKGKEFAKRVTLIDPTYRGGSKAYNPLEMPEDGDLQAAASAIVYGFKAIYTEPPGSQSQWNPQTANILRNAALLLIANNKTLIDLPTLLQDNDFRDILLEGVEKKKAEKVEYISLLETWGQYKKLARTDQWITWVEPILNRVTPMLSDPRIRPILTKPVGDLSLKKVIQDRKILLVKIPQGQLDQNANLLGSLIVTGLKQAALSLGGHKDRDRPVALYMDEFDNFIEKETLENITSETKKFQIGFVGAIKTLQHLPEDFRNQLIINVGIINAFALAKKDGDMLGPQMFRVDGRKIKHQTISNFFNKVNTSPQFELISDEEKLNIDRVVGQEERTFFCYRVGTVAGVFNMKAPDFADTPDKSVKGKLIEKMHGVDAQEGGENGGSKKRKKRDDDDDDE